jgi:prophage DNA circulation protein
MARTFPVTLSYYIGGKFDVAFGFDYEHFEDHFGNSIARYEFPYKQGALLANMGQRARVTRGRCYFINDNYDTHKILINYLGAEFEEGGTWELTHPEYGTIKGEIESLSVHHDDRVSTAEVDLVFIEQYRGLIAPQTGSAPASITREAWDYGQTQMQSHVRQRIRSAHGPSLLKTLIATASLVSQFSRLKKSATAFIRSAEVTLKALVATESSVTNPSNSLVSTTTYDADLSGVMVKNIALAVERHAITYAGLLSSPDRFLASFNSAVAETAAASGDFAAYVKIAGAQRAAVELGSAFDDNEQARLAWEQSSSQKSFSVTGRYLKDETPDRPLTVQELEKALATVRASLQEAIDEAREMESLRTMALALTDYVIEVKQGSPAIKTVSVANETPLHVLCLRYGLSYQDAESLMAINRIRHPSFVKGEVNVYAG